MPRVCVNGVWRSINNYTNLNGIWRKKNEWECINGVWRTGSQETFPFTSEDIAGFKMIYRRSYDTRYSRFPDMVDNPNIPASATITGSHDFDEEASSILFQYSNDDPEIEGLCVYTGTLYALTYNGDLIAVSDIMDSALNPEPDMEISVKGYTLYENHGPAVPLGWNRFFSFEDNIPTDINQDKNTYFMNPYAILPTYKRIGSYGLISMIGIARNMTNREFNMVGSRGVLDHTIQKIFLNGVSMPFTINLSE